MIGLELTLAAANVLLIMLSAWAARALREFSRHELEELCQQRGRRKLLSDIIRHHEKASLAAETLQVLATAVFLFSGGYWAWTHYPGGLWWCGLVGGVVLLAAEIWLPWAFTRLWAERYLYHTWMLWRGVQVMLGPFVVMAGVVDTIFHRLAGRQPEPLTEETFEDEIRTIVTEGHREGLLEEDEREMIEGVIELGDATADQVMTPRTDVVCLPLATSLPDVFKFIAEVGYTRIPVYDKNLDDVVGVLYTRDLIPAAAGLNGQDQQPLKDLLRKPHFVPETKAVKALLQEFQKTRNHMALVLDEYGGVSGLVTIEDVLEEIVGEIVDEYDKELDQEIWPAEDGTFDVLARIHVDELNERLGLELDEKGDFDTIGGLVFSELGHVPTVGESVRCGNVTITVTQATARRIERLRVVRHDDANGSPHESGDR